MPKGNGDDQPEIKTTIRVPQDLWLRARHRALEERMPVQNLVVRALEAYLSKKGGSK